jgi:hypothetical protein
MAPSDHDRARSPSNGLTAVQHVLDEIPEVAALTAFTETLQGAVGGVAAELLQEPLLTIAPRLLTTGHGTPPRKISELRAAPSQSAGQATVAVNR